MLMKVEMDINRVIAKLCEYFFSLTVLASKICMRKDIWEIT